MAESQASQASNAFISQDTIASTVSSVVSNEEASLLQSQAEQAHSEEPTQGVDPVLAMLKDLTGKFTDFQKQAADDRKAVALLAQQVNQASTVKKGAHVKNNGKKANVLLTDANVCVDQQVLNSDGVNRHFSMVNNMESNLCAEKQKKTIDNVCISELYPPTNATSVPRAGTGARPRMAQDGGTSTSTSRQPPLMTYEQFYQYRRLRRGSNSSL